MLCGVLQLMRAARAAGGFVLGACAAPAQLHPTALKELELVLRLELCATAPLHGAPWLLRLR